MNIQELLSKVRELNGRRVKPAKVYMNNRDIQDMYQAVGSHSITYAAVTDELFILGIPVLREDMLNNGDFLIVDNRCNEL